MINKFKLTITAYLKFSEMVFNLHADSLFYLSKKYYILLDKFKNLNMF